MPVRQLLYHQGSSSCSNNTSQDTRSLQQSILYCNSARRQRVFELVRSEVLLNCGVSVRDRQVRFRSSSVGTPKLPETFLSLFLHAPSLSVDLRLFLVGILQGKERDLSADAVTEEPYRPTAPHHITSHQLRAPNGRRAERTDIRRIRATPTTAAVFAHVLSAVDRAD